MVTIIKRGTSVKEIRERIRKAVARDNIRDIMQYARKLKTAIDPLKYKK